MSMSRTNEVVLDLVGIAKEIEYFSNNVSFITEAMAKSWAEEIKGIAENEIGYD